MSELMTSAATTIDELVTPARARAINTMMLGLGWLGFLLIGMAIEFIVWGFIGIFGWVLTYALLFWGWRRNR